jgi:CheY-like chemotaxis protein
MYVLAVDDQADALEFLRVLCQAEGYEFVAATSGAQALEACRARRPDLAIVDIMMPGMTGFELCDLLRSDISSRGIPIIVYSAHEVRPYSNSGLYDMAFVKPAEPEDLLRAIRLLLPDPAVR